MRRALTSGCLTLALVASLAAPAEASADLEQQLVDFVNHERSARGLTPLTLYWDLMDDARLHAGRMAGRGTLYHNPQLSGVTGGWYALAENVGRGTALEVIERAFMDSSPHRANILGDFNYLGVGVVSAGGTLYVDLVFMKGPAGLVDPGTWSVFSLPGGFPSSEAVGFHDPRTGLWHEPWSGKVRTFFYGNPADVPVVCDWDGDGVETVGLYRPSTGFLHLRNSNTQGFSHVAIFYGNPADLPVCGDWDRDGVATIGIWRPSDQTFYLRNSNSHGRAHLSFRFGDPGDVPLAGDWDGDGRDTVGVYRPSTGQVLLTNRLGSSVADYTGYYGNPGDRILAGDWDGDGRDTLGIFRPSEGTFYLSDRLGSVTADVIIRAATVGLTPLAGRWSR